MALSLAALLAGSFVVSGPTPQPDGPGFTLEWSAPATCPDAAALRGWVAYYVGNAEVEPVHPLTADAFVETDTEDGFTVRLTLVDQRHTERTVRAPTCEQLTRAIALMVAVRLHPLEVGARPAPTVVPAHGTPPPRPSPSPRPSPPPTTTASPPPEPQLPVDTVTRDSRPPSQPAWTRRGWTAVAGSLATGTGPRMAAGVSGSVGVEGIPWRIEAEGTYWPTAAFETSSPGVTGELQLLTLAVRGCGVASWEHWRVPLCAGVRGGALRGVGRGDVSTPRPAWAPWLDVVVEPSVVWIPRRRLGLRVGVGAAVSLARARFEVGPASAVVFQVPAANARAFAGLEIYFYSRNDKASPSE